MKLTALKRWATTLLLAVACLAFAPFAPAAAKKAQPSPQISSFVMEPVDKVAAGTELFFRVQGTANARATVRVAGVSRTLVLQEVDDGVYEGSYVLRANDRATGNSSATTTLRLKGRASTATLARLGAPGAPPAATPPAPPPKPGAPTISAFSVAPIDKIEPGAELKFTLTGTPGAKASVTIKNVVSNVPMREMRSGHYEGGYTIRRADRLGDDVPVVATLELAGQSVHRELGRQSLLADSKPPQIKNVYPRDGETMSSGPISISGTFDDQGGLGVDPKTVRLQVGGRDVTGAATITKDYFTYRAELAAGNYPVEVTVKDLAGNAGRSAWSFAVQAQTAATLPLEITSHRQNSVVAPGRIDIAGRTAPGATVDVEAVGMVALAGKFGISNRLHSERLKADGNGNFGFSFAPLNVPGMRIEIRLKAERGGQTRDMQLVLFRAR
jgi:hypothetical protein